jgi:isopentenyldiphosphate isomerase
MTKTEWFDIFDERMEWLGKATRAEVHAKGLWHQTFHCWIIKDRHQLLLQLRRPEKDTYPNLLDISCAGHLSAGEGVEEGIRELEEELGLQVPFEALTRCGTFAEEDEIDVQLIDREFQHVYVYACDQPLEQYKVQRDEVSGLFLVHLNDFRALVYGETASIQSAGWIYSDVHDLPVQRVIDSSKLVPRPIEYYDMLFRNMDDYMKKINK